MTTCIDLLQKPEAHSPAVDPFALYLTEQLITLNKRQRLFAEKSINGILFELRFAQLDNNTQFPTENHNLQSTPFPNYASPSSLPPRRHGNSSSDTQSEPLYSPISYLADMSKLY